MLFVTLSNFAQANNFLDQIFLNFKTKIQENLQTETGINLSAELLLMTPFSYDNTTVGTLTNQADCNTVLTRTINVTDNFLINDLNVGLVLESTIRGNLQVTLTSPQGISIDILTPREDGDNNFNLLLDDASTNAADNSSNDPLTPIYEANRTASPHSALANFNGRQAMGNWTLTICNRDVFGNGTSDVTFHSARLVFDGTTAANCTMSSLDFSTQCNDNGTATINDDFYTVNLLVNGIQLGSGYSVTGNYGINSFSETGFSYDSPATLAVQLPIGVHTDIVVTDNDDPNCQINARILSPAECSTPFMCWAISDEGDQSTYQFDSGTGLWSDLGQTGVTNIEALAYDALTGIIYTANQDEPGTITPPSSTFVTIAGINIGVLQGADGPYDISDIDGLTFDPFTRVLWASERKSGNDYLFQIDITTGDYIPNAFGPGIDYVVAQEVFDPVNGQNVFDLDDIAIDPYNGDLYAVSNQGGLGGVLTILNKEDGTVKKVIGNFAGIDDIEALGFYNSGTLFGSTGNNSPDPADLNRYFQINKLDASLTEVNRIDPTNSDRDFEACDCLSGPPNRITGTVFHDLNGDGILAGGEPGEGQILINLYRDVDGDSMLTVGVDILLDTIFTANDGTYEFIAASTGDFLINIDQTTLPDNSSMTTDNHEAALFISTNETNPNNNFGFAFTCELTINNVSSSNCTGSNPYTAQWDVDISWVNQPTGDIAYQRNDEAVQTITPTGNAQTLVFPNIPADGGTFDTLKIYFANDPLCGDTIIIKRPLPCPADVAPCASAAGCLGGNVFEDYNCNGTEDGNEPGVQGIEIQVYDCNNTLVGTSYSDNDGDWQVCGLTDGTAYRIEHILPEAVACWATPTHVAGGGNQSDIQFLTAPACTQFSVSSPADYCQENPLIGLPCYVSGDPTAGGSSGMSDWWAGFRYNDSGEIGGAGYTAPEFHIDGTLIGTTWGSAYHRNTQNFLLGATMKRHSGFGANGTGAIYTIDDNGTPSFFVDLNTLPGINTGADTRDGSPNNSLPASSTDLSRDIDAFQAVGKVGLGDLELSDDEQYLYTVNLNQRTLVELFVGNNLTAPTSGTIYDIPTALDNIVSGTSKACGTVADYRPWGLEFYKGLLYIGVVCSAETSQVASEVHAYVLSFDPANPANGFSLVLDVDMGYNRDPAFQSDNAAQTIPGTWRPWALTYNDATILPWNGAAHPSPILTDIEIDVDGSFILGFMDRFGMQSGYRQVQTDLSDTDTNHQGLSAGDVIRFCNVNGTLTQEGNAGCPTNIPPPVTDPGTFTPTPEFYVSDQYFSNITSPAHGHPETSLGNLALFPGKGEVIAGNIDPFVFRSGGVAWWSNTDGSTNKEYELYESLDQSTPDGTFSKAVGLGDIEIKCDAAPLEIGNYVWCDSLQNGIQDACERGINNILVQLFDRNGNLVGQDTTSNSGQYYFNENNIDSTGITVNGSGIATPNSGNFTGMSYDTQYFIVFGNGQFAGGEFNTGSEIFGITTLNDAGMNDNIDSDVDANNLTTANNQIPAGLPFIDMTTATTGCGDHKFDLGLRCGCELTNADLLDITCHENGTIADPADDYLTFSLNPTGFNISATYNVSVSSGTIMPTTANYGAATTFQLQNGSAGAGDVTVTITDTSDNACQLEVLIIDPGNCARDVDGPNPRPGFPPCPNQPCHIVNNDLKMGNTITADDPNDAVDDADGTVFPNNLRAGTTIRVRTTIMNNTGITAYLYAWADLNNDDDFDDPGENFIVQSYTNTGMFEVVNELVIPSDADPTEIALRFRLSTDQNAINSPCGPALCAPDGEVEDYVLELECPPTICLPTEIQINQN